MTESAAQDINDVFVVNNTGDELLSNLASVAQSIDGFGMGITLTVPGGVVTGTLIGRDQWFDAVVESVKDVEGASDLWEPIRDAVRDFYATDDDDEEEGRARYGYVHLRDAQVISPTGAMPNQGLLWRGRIEEVSGWAPGKLTRTEG